MKTHNLFLFGLIAVLALAGCSTPTGTATVQVPVNTVDPTVQPTKAADSTSPAPSEGQTVYQIVAEESKVSYEVGETFLNDNNRLNLAVGVTTDVTGEIMIDHENPQNSTIGPITVNVNKFTSDSGRRDNVIRNDWLQSSKYPQAVFTPTSIEGLPAAGVEGQSYDLQITGDLKIKETVRTVTFTASVSLSGNELTGVAETTLLMSDFGVGPISIAGILNTEDEVHLIFNIVARS